MKKLRKKFEIFCHRNRDKGIPNLMLYIVIGCGMVTALSLLGYGEIYYFLCFDRTKILQGQIWRLFTYVFTVSSGNMLMTMIVLYCTYSLGRAVENTWGTCKFTLYYLFTIILMDLFAMLFGGNTFFYAYENGQSAALAADVSAFYSSSMASILHLSMVICFATLYPDAQFVLFFLIPIKAKILSLIYLGYILFQVIQLSVPVLTLPHNLFPLVAMLSYFLFFGSDVKNLLPLSWQVRRKKKKKTVPVRPTVATEPVQFRTAKEAKKETAYTHRCTVCGRTDVSDPDLEFRYCSRCNGYYCYCEDHISNHAHIE